MSKYRVRVIDFDSVAHMDYLSVYGDCPEVFTDRAEAEVWAEELNNSGEWPDGNPGYEVVEVED